MEEIGSHEEIFYVWLIDCDATSVDVIKKSLRRRVVEAREGHLKEPKD